MAMKAMERRLLRLEPAIARLHPPQRLPIDETRLTAEEWAEATRIGEITKVGGMDALSADDLELAACLTGKLAGEEIATCLA
jgi:hypothetical protein